VAAVRALAMAMVAMVGHSPKVVGFCARSEEGERKAEWLCGGHWGRYFVVRYAMVERGSPLGTPRDNVALQRDNTSVLRNYEATVDCGGADSAIDASPGEDGILGSRERSTVACSGRIDYNPDFY
jgi:hypothetical protein